MRDQLGKDSQMNMNEEKVIGKIEWINEDCVNCQNKEDIDICPKLKKKGMEILKIDMLSESVSCGSFLPIRKTYCIEDKGECLATGFQTGMKKGFIVLKDSLVRKTIGPSFEGCYLRIRELLISEGIIVPHNNANLRFSINHLFSSSSRAASVVLGSSSSGPITWKDINGSPLKQDILKRDTLKLSVDSQ